MFAFIAVLSMTLKHLRENTGSKKGGKVSRWSLLVPKIEWKTGRS